MLANMKSRLTERHPPHPHYAALLTHVQLMYSFRGLYKNLNVTPTQNKVLSDMTYD